MKQHLGPALKLSLCCLLVCSFLYPAVVWVIGRWSPGHGNGQWVYLHGRKVGFALIGQPFREDRYFWGRPSAVGYNAAASGGSNWGPSNPQLVQAVKQRLDTFLVHDPGIQASQVPIDLLTASGSGLDPDISPQAAYIQVPRIARARKITAEQLRQVVAAHVDRSWLGPARVNVLELNVALDSLP